MHRLAVSCNYCHAVPFDGHLRWANRGEGVDHAEPIAPAGCNCEYFERRVCHETSVGITELAFAVDQHGFRILAGVHGQTSRIPLCRILMQPVANEHYVRGQIEVVKVGVGIARRRLPHHNAAVETIKLL